MGLRRYWSFVGLLVLCLLAAFAAVEWASPSVLTDPQAAMGSAGIGAALLGVGLLAADIVIPVPSSLVMIANGALFGVAAGATLSIVGSLAAALIGLVIGRRGGAVMARFVPAAERERADQLLADWGAVAIVATRPIPLLAEVTVIMAGASDMKWPRLALAAVAGAVPIAILYAVAGAAAATGVAGAPLLAFAAALMMAGLFWIAGRAQRNRVVGPQPTGSLTSTRSDEAPGPA